MQASTVASSFMLFASLLACGGPAAADTTSNKTLRCFKVPTPGDPDTWEGKRVRHDCVGSAKSAVPISYIAPQLYQSLADAAVFAGAPAGHRRIKCYKLATPDDPTLGAGYFLNGNCFLTRIDPAPSEKPR